MPSWWNTPKYYADYKDLRTLRQAASNAFGRIPYTGNPMQYLKANPEIFRSELRTLTKTGKRALGIRHIPKFVGIDLALNLTFAGIESFSEGITKSTEWAAKSGDPADYFGGFYYGTRGGFSKGIGATIGSALGLIGGAFIGPTGAMVGGVAGSIVGSMVGGLGDPYFRGKGLYISDVARSSMSARRVNFGNRFRDTREAYTMRQMAVQEMSGSLLNARQYLGNEAAFFH